MQCTMTKPKTERNVRTGVRMTDSVNRSMMIGITMITDRILKKAVRVSTSGKVIAAMHSAWQYELFPALSSAKILRVQLCNIP